MHEKVDGDHNPLLEKGKGRRARVSSRLKLDLGLSSKRTYDGSGSLELGEAEDSSGRVMEDVEEGWE